MTKADLRAVLAANLRMLRNERGLAQKELARKAGVAQNHVAQLEHCVHHASLKIIERLALALGVDPFELLKPRKTPLGRRLDSTSAVRALKARR